MSGTDLGKSTPVVAVDTGGTFTDLLLLQGGRLTALKLFSTPEDPAVSVLEGLRRILGEESDGACRVILGSTVATNTLLERSGARVALVTNEGFQDVIEIGRQNRPQLYALVGTREPPLVAREDRHLGSAKSRPSLRPRCRRLCRVRRRRLAQPRRPPRQGRG